MSLDWLNRFTYEEDLDLSDSTIGEWVSNLEKKELSLVDYSALIALNKKATHPYEEQSASMISTFERSYGIDSSSEKLSKNTLRKFPREDRLIYLAAYEAREKNPRSRFKIFWDNYFFHPMDLMIAAAFFYAFWQMNTEVFLAVALGLITCSLVENLIHDKIAHADEKTKEFLKSLGHIGEKLRVVNLEHSVHHCSHKKDYLVPFGGKNQQRIINKLKIHVEKNFDRDVWLQLEDGNFGTTNPTVFRTHLYFIPFSLLIALILLGLFALLGYHFGLVFLLVYIFVSQTWITTSCYLHPLLHKSMVDLEREYSGISLMLIKSRLFRYIARVHKTHHSSSGKWNQNIIFGLDFLLGYRPIDLKDLTELKKANALY